MSRNSSGKVQLLPLVGKIALCAGTAIFGPAALTTSVGGSIALNVLGGWAGEAIGSIPSLRTFRRKDEPNHDLQKAFARAIGSACADLKVEQWIREKTNFLSDLAPPNHARVEDFFHALLKKPEQALGIASDNAALAAFLESPGAGTFAPIADALGKNNLPGLDDKLRQEMITMLYERVAARFWDEVKSDDLAWRAYSGYIFAGFRSSLDFLTEGQQKLLDFLKARESECERGMPPEVGKAIDSLRADLESRFQEFDRKLGEVLRLARDTKEDTGYIRGKIDQLLPPAPHKPPHELPAAATHFVGRAAQKEKLAGFLKAGMSAAVLGPAGMGKTALAAEVLGSLFGVADPTDLCRRHFPDGLVFLDLYRLKARAIDAWNTLANSLAGAGHAPNAEARDRATTAAHGKRFLLVVEGAEEADGEEDRATLAELLGVLPTAASTLILTRNSDQAPASIRVKVEDRLDPDDAKSLFLHHFGEDPSPPDSLVLEMLTLLEGHPLAISWAAGLLGAEGHAAGGLATDWRSMRLPPLRDPDPKARQHHTLRWLFLRGLRGLPPETRARLDAAALLARAPFPASLLGGGAEPALRDLARRSILRALPGGEWEFTHVLGYQFAREELSAETTTTLAPNLALALSIALLEILPRSGFDEVLALSGHLAHAAALLEKDEPPGLWSNLASPLLYKIQDLLVSRGRLDSVEFSLRAVESWLVRCPAEDPDWQRENATCLNRLGDLAVARGDLDDANRRFSAALAIAQKLADSDPGNAEWQRDLSISHDRLGDLAVARGNLDDANRRFSSSLLIRQKLADSDPGNAQWQRDLSISHERLGDLAVAQGDLDDANRRFSAALAIAQKLADSDPGNAEWQRDLSISLNKLGSLAVARGDLDDANRRFSSSLLIRQKLADSDPGNAQWQRDLSVSLNKLGDLAVARGDLDDANRRFSAALAIAQKLADSDPGNAQWQRDLFVSHTKLANLAEKRGNEADAKRHLRSAHDILEAMDRRGIHLSPGDRQILGALKHRLGILTAGEAG